jgi:hypothetical protein
LRVPCILRWVLESRFSPAEKSVDGAHVGARIGMAGSR